MTSSVTSSRKRARVICWEDVVLSHHLRDITVDKDQLVKALERNVPNAYEYLNYTNNIRRLMCEDCGITGWEDKLVTAIHEVVRYNGSKGVCGDGSSREQGLLWSIIILYPPRWRCTCMHLMLFLATSAGCVTISV